MFVNNFMEDVGSFSPSHAGASSPFSSPDHLMMVFRPPVVGMSHQNSHNGSGKSFVQQQPSTSTYPTPIGSPKSNANGSSVTSPKFSSLISPELNFFLQQPNGILNQNSVPSSPPKQSLLEKIHKDDNNARFLDYSPTKAPTPGALFGPIGSPKQKNAEGTEQSSPVTGSNNADSSPTKLFTAFPESPKLPPSRKSSINSTTSSSSRSLFRDSIDDNDSGSGSSVDSSPALGPAASPAGAEQPAEEVVFVNGTWKSCAFQQAQLLREFAVIPRKLIKKLVLMTEKEPWGNNNEVLLSYLNYTFRRLIDEKKILGYFPTQNSDKHSTMKPIALCFNTGLLTSTYDRVYCFLAPNKNLKEAFHLNNTHKKFVEWFVTLFLKESDIKKENGNIVRSKLGVAPIAPEMFPKRTGYYSDKTPAKELVWNCNTPIEIISIEEIIKNMKQNDKLADVVNHYNEEELAAKIKSAISISIKRAECNPRIAVPQFYWDKNSSHGEVQLLLPLEIESLGLKCAITVRVSNMTGKYEIRTILSLNQAYTNARLVQKVDQAWLGKHL